MVNLRLSLSSVLGLAMVASLPAVPKATQSGKPPAASQASSPPAVKGVWEPVNYPEDLTLNDAFFVTPEIGWVAGAGGTILHTRDAGATWTAQLGGDPQSKDAPIGRLRFVSETQGWAIQSAGIEMYKLLSTTDGQRWSTVSTFRAYGGLLDYAFTTPTNGVHVAANENVAAIHHTTDGGRTWKEAFPLNACRSRMEVQGLTRELSCTIKSLHMATATTGYAFGGFTRPDVLLVLKTEDGGASWKMSPATVSADVYTAFWSQAAFFIDENRGIVGLNGREMQATSDGGRTWQGVVGTPGNRIRFADPEVGWSFRDRTLSYTVDGGNRWTSRTFTFPANVQGFSFPRRDSAFVVGEHGMVYRYSVVSIGATAARSIDAPAMPAVDSAIYVASQQIEQQVEAVTVGSKNLPAKAPPAPGPGSATGSTLIDGCCAKVVTQLETAVATLTAAVPAFSSRFRNLNLPAAGIQLIGSLQQQSAGLKASVLALRRAGDLPSIETALAELKTQAVVATQSAKAALQRK